MKKSIFLMLGLTLLAAPQMFAAIELHSCFLTRAAGLPLPSTSTPEMS